MFFMLIILTQFYLKHVDVGTPLQENQSKDKREGIHTHQQQHCLKKLEKQLCALCIRIPQDHLRIEIDIRGLKTLRPQN